MKKTLLPLLAAVILSAGCARSLPAAAPVPSEPAAPAAASSLSEPEAPKAQSPESGEEKPSESAPPVSSSAASSDEASQQPPAAAAEPQPSSGAAPPSSPETPDPSSDRDWRLMLVNPWNLLPEGYVPELTMTKYGYEVDSRIVDDVTALIEGAAKDGVSLIICYGYRTLEQSQQLFDKQLRKQLSYGLSEEAALAEAKRWVAPPGTSDHHTGLALDIVTPEYQVLNHGFYDTPAGRWMEAHGWEYGFVVRFPADKQDITGITYEPWHMRFVGKEHAAAMHRSGECLEEYVERLYGK